MIANNPLNKTFRITIPLLAVLLCLELVWLFIGVSLSNQTRAQKLSGYAVESPAIAALPEMEHFNEAIERSLFSWNRRPVASNQQPVSEENLSSRWTLSGIVQTGTTTYAMFSETEGDRRLKLEQGMYLEKWRIGNITHEQVILKNEEEEEIFYLKEGITTKKQTTLKKKSNRINRQVEQQDK